MSQDDPLDTLEPRIPVVELLPVLTVFFIELSFSFNLSILIAPFVWLS